MAISVPKSVKPICDFTIQVVIGAFAFIVVYLAAAAISCVVKAVGGIVPDWVAHGGEWAEKALFVSDLACFGFFVLSEVIKLGRALVKATLEDWKSQ